MSTVFRVQKNANYTTMSNYHLKDRRLSYKAKGLLSVILSLPDEWDYSLKGLSYISDDGVDSVRSTVRELEKFGYISRGAQTRNERGQMSANTYYVYENPEQNPHFKSKEENGLTELNPTALENPTRSDPEEITALENPTRSENFAPTALDFPITENPSTDNPTTESPTTVSYYNKILTNQVLNDQSIHQSNSTDRIDENNVRKNFSFSVLKEKSPDGCAEREKYREIIRRNIEYEYYPESEKKRVDEFVEIMLDVICSGSTTVRANGAEMPAEAVRSRFLNIRSDHIDYVLDALHRAAPDIRNIRAYLITALYNAPVTEDNYYSAQARHDIYIGKI